MVLIPRLPLGAHLTRGLLAVATVLAALAPWHAHADSRAILGTPANGSTVSGVNVISGYHCTSKAIRITIDDVSVAAWWPPDAPGIGIIRFSP